MKVIFIVDDNLEEDELVIKHNKENTSIPDLHHFLLNLKEPLNALEVYNDTSISYLQIEEIIFFESSDNNIYAHTKLKTFLTKLKLYELEEILPNYFIRISKSAICNVKEILSIDRHITSSRLITFRNSSKEVYVSRMYYPQLKLKLEKRLSNEL